MIIEISPKKIIKDAVTVWNQPGPEVDVVMDPKNLTFREGSIKTIYAFHVLDHLFENEIVEAMNNWRKCLVAHGELFVIVDDFEHLARAFVGGDIDIESFNLNFTHPTNFTLELMVSYYKRAGFNEEKVVKWFEMPGFPKEEHELITSVSHE